MAPRWLAEESPALVYAGVAAIVGGLGLVAYAWLRIADVSAVALQLPYLASSGFTGIGLIVVGAALVNVAAKRRESAARRRQLRELAQLVAVLRDRP